MKIAGRMVVSIHYTLRDAAGRILDTTDGREPLVYLHGAGEILPGLERALEGHLAGDCLTIAITAADGYGERDPEGRFDVDRAAFPPGIELAAGDELLGELDDGASVPVRIVGIDGARVTVDTNHPLAGVALHFEVEVRGVRLPTDEEIARGHAVRFTLGVGLPQH